jgi:hypothetical protein
VVQNKQQKSDFLLKPPQKKAYNFAMIVLLEKRETPSAYWENSPDPQKTHYGIFLSQSHTAPRFLTTKPNIHAWKITPSLTIPHRVCTLTATDTTPVNSGGGSIEIQ